MMKKSPSSLFVWIFALCMVTFLTSCGKSDGGPKKTRPATIVTTAQVASEPLEIAQETVGYADSESAPFVSAEIAGRVIKLNVDVGQKVAQGAVLAELDAQDQRIARQAASAEVKRIQALLDAQERLVERYQKLVQENFVSKTALENNESQLAALREQLEVAKAQLETAERNLVKTRVVAPVSGRVEQRMVALGDYVSLGKPMFQIATSHTLRVHLLFPETIAPQIRTGLRVRLSSPAAPGRAVEGRVSDIRPTIGSANRAIDVIVEVANPGDWRPGASVNGAVVVSERQALTVPELSVVLRPAGEVAYVVANNQVEQRIVKTGARQAGKVEIQSGLNAGESVVVDGAAYLTDKAAVTVRMAQNQENQAPPGIQPAAVRGPPANRAAAQEAAK